MKINIEIRNPKTCKTWAKIVRKVDLGKQGGWAVEGDFFSSSSKSSYEDDTLSPGSFVILNYQGGSWQNQERWAALIQEMPESKDSDSGYRYGDIEVEGGKIIFFASDRGIEDVYENLKDLGVVLDNTTRKKAKNPVYACAVAYAALQKTNSLPSLPDGWEWGPEASGIHFLRRTGHSELVFPTQPFLPADFLKNQAERLAGLAQVASTAAEMAEAANKEVQDATH